MSTSSPSFLPHVNGMRALAILGIVAYHLHATCCPAGYFGVDVFLVISGYFLLASLMKAERPADVHYGTSLLKKSWRILPSWLVVTLVFCCGSAAFMIAPDRVEICHTALRSAWFGADYYIDHLYDYFNQKAHQNLFLHYWYLSLICQLYVLLPLLVMLLLLCCSRRGVLACLGIFGLLSLSFCVLVNTPQVSENLRHALLQATGMKTAYYHLLPRLWEVLAGGVVLLLPAWEGRPRLRCLLASLGLLGMVASFFCYETGSAQVYLAVVSAVLLLRWGAEGWVSRLLAWRPLQWVGTMSFSLYLWHWPVMAAWKYVKLGEVTVWDELGMLALSFLAGALAWRVVERLKMPRGTGYAVAWLRFVPLALLLLVASLMRPYYKAIKRSANDGLIGQGLIREHYEHMQSSPHDAALLRGFEPRHWWRSPGYMGSAEAGAPGFILMGDSHAAHLFPGMQRACQQGGWRGISLNNDVFPFWWCYQEGYWSEARAESLLAYLRAQPTVRYVFIALLWQNRLCGTAKDNAGPTLDWRGMKSLNTEEQIALREAGLAETCRRLTAMGRRVVFLADVPLLPPNLSPWQLCQKSLMLRGEEAPEYLTPLEMHRRDAARYRGVMERIVQAGQAWAIIDCAEPLRRGNEYRTRNDAGQFLYSDNNHLTLAGSELVGRYVVEQWQRLLRAEEAGNAGNAAAAGLSASPQP